MRRSELVERSAFLSVLDKEELDDEEDPDRRYDEDDDENDYTDKEMIDADDKKCVPDSGDIPNASEVGPKPQENNEDVDELEAAARELEEGVRYWSDFLKAQTHEKTMNLLEGYWEGVLPFDSYGDGRAALQESWERREAVTDRVRYFLEGCDSPQGMHCIADVSGGFAGKI